MQDEDKDEPEYDEIDTAHVRKPIMHPDVHKQVDAAMSQYENRHQWRRWGMHTVREQGSAILMVGPHGTGKTMIARWMGKRMKKKVKILDVATIANGDPGASEREVIRFFTFCRENNCIVFMDECDALLGDRSQISADGRTWQLSTEEQIMVQMNVFPGLVICATNHEGMLDPALADRFLYIIRVERPDRIRRALIWKQKWPQLFPLKLKERDAKSLSLYDLSGRQIENVLCAVASEAISTGKRPTYEMFHEHCNREQAKHIEKGDNSEEL